MPSDEQSARQQPLPGHVEETLAAIAAMHAAHHEKASALDRAIDRLASFFARPRFLVYIVAVMALWVAANLAAGFAGKPAFDAAPFPLTDQKTTKLIDLMEEFRRDSPGVKDRVDLEAMEMAGTPDHGTVLQAIEDITDNPTQPPR
jgi:hypothetical protein